MGHGLKWIYPGYWWESYLAGLPISTHTHTPIVNLPSSLSLSFPKVQATAGTANFVGGTGTVTAAKFIDSANSAYVLTPSATGNSLLVAGKVGIGTTGPAQALDVVGTGKYSVGIIAPKIYPSADSTTAFQINKADGTTNVLNVDTTNARVGVGTASPGQTLSVAGTIESTTGGFKFPDGTTQTAAVPATALTNFDQSRLTMTNANTLYDAASVSLAAGTWLVGGQIYFYNRSGAWQEYQARIWDGTTTYAISDGFIINTAFGTQTVTPIPIVLGSTTTIKISGVSTAAGDEIRVVPNNNSPGNYATYISTVRIK